MGVDVEQAGANFVKVRDVLKMLRKVAGYSEIRKAATVSSSIQTNRERLPSQAMGPMRCHRKRSSP